MGVVQNTVQHVMCINNASGLARKPREKESSKITKPPIHDFKDVNLNCCPATNTSNPTHAQSQDVHQCGSSDMPIACHESINMNTTMRTIWNGVRKMLQW